MSKPVIPVDFYRMLSDMQREIDTLKQNSLNPPVSSTYTPPVLARGSSGAGADGVQNTTITGSQTVAADDNLLAVFIIYTPSTNGTVSFLSTNGATAIGTDGKRYTLTIIGNTSFNATGAVATARAVQCFYLKNPPKGNITIEATCVPTGGTANNFSFLSATWKNASQALPVENGTGNRTTNGTTTTFNTTTTSGPNSEIVSLLAVRSTTKPTIDLGSEIISRLYNTNVWMLVKGVSAAVGVVNTAAWTPADQAAMASFAIVSAN